MPSTSKSQQRLMGLAYSVKKGDTKRSEVSQAVLDLVDSMSLKQLRDFASTKHKDLPESEEFLTFNEFFNESLNILDKLKVAYKITTLGAFQELVDAEDVDDLKKALTKKNVAWEVEPKALKINGSDKVAFYIAKNQEELKKLWHNKNIKIALDD